MSINYSAILQEIESNLFLIKGKIQKIDEDIINADEAVKKDIEKIVSQHINGNSKKDEEKRKIVIARVDNKHLLESKINYLKNAKNELGSLEKKQGELRSRLLKRIAGRN